MNAELVSELGAVGVRSAVEAEQLPGVLKAYNDAVTNTFVSLSQLFEL